MCDQDHFDDDLKEFEARGTVTRRQFGVLLGAGVALMLPKVVDAVAVTESEVTIKTPDGTCDAYFVHPATAAPGVLIWPDIFGLRPAFRQMGKRLAENGYSVLVINPFYRKMKAPTATKGSATPIPELMPLARLITPNIPEAETLSGMPITNESHMNEATAKLREAGARAVLIKGGHLSIGRTVGSSTETGIMPALSAEAVDLLDDEGAVTTLRGEWIDGPPVRGTGCMLSAAIAAGLAHGRNLPESVNAAKRFVARALRYASQLSSEIA